MAIRKSDDRARESDSAYNESKNAFKAANITERFDDSTDNDNPYDDVLQYVNKKLDEVIDQVNLDEAKVTNVATNLSVASSTGARVIASSDGTNATIPIATTSVSGVMSKAMFDQHTANNAKPSAAVAKNLSNTAQIGESKVDVKMTITLSRGAYSLTFTMTHGSTTKTATIALR